MNPFHRRLVFDRIPCDHSVLKETGDLRRRRARINDAVSWGTRLRRKSISNQSLLSRLACATVSCETQLLTRRSPLRDASCYRSTDAVQKARNCCCKPSRRLGLALRLPIAKAEDTGPRRLQTDVAGITTFAGSIITIIEGIVNKVLWNIAKKRQSNAIPDKKNMQS